ncbi:MAG: 3-phosphoshikimate 1-carboxyvinyltransferase [Candidatus Sericytochromatia bacterium]|nr:3-phosphoshikimate 1-carboxyvinyltransferase [Candidatus Sericytochromatia bacterium]
MSPSSPFPLGASDTPQCREVQPARCLQGELVVPADKSMSHRAALLASLARGRSRVENFLTAQDCLDTVACLELLGVPVSWAGPTTLLVDGVGLDGLREPADALWAGNSGTTMRLLAGVAAGIPGLTVLRGDASLLRRPMARIREPLLAMGARIDGREGGRFPPLVIRGGPLRPLRWRSPVASAQVKSAVLLAGLFVEGETSVCEPAISRDHTERMLTGAGVPVWREGTTVALRGRVTPSPLDFRVPGDLSSAAFWLVAASVLPGSELRIRGVGVNPTRTGVLDVLLAMGADIRRENEQIGGGEPFCDLVVRSACLRGTTIGGEIVPRLIDELPILAVAAACADGRTLFTDVDELRHKESDRLRAIVRCFSALGVEVQETPEGLSIQGGAQILGGQVASGGDHRIAMCLAVLGLLASGPVTVVDTACVATSYPAFFSDLQRIVQR